MVRVRAFGAFAMRVVDPPALVRELVGTDPEFRTEEVSEYLRQLVVGRFGTALATSGIPVLDMAAQQGELGDHLLGTINQDLAGVGIQLVRLIVENISLPPEVEQAVDKRTEMGVVGDLGRYTQFQAANAVEQAARNPGGGAGEGVGVGMGMAPGQQLAAGMAQPQAGGQQPPASRAPTRTRRSAAAAGRRAVVPGGRRADRPFGRGELAERTANGTLTAATLVWRSGMSEWQPAGGVPELAPLFGDVPPSLPQA